MGLPMAECCESCRFGLFDLGFTYGNCRRYPPKVKVDKHGKQTEYRPDVYSEDWCGEYEANKVQQRAEVTE